MLEDKLIKLIEDQIETFLTHITHQVQQVQGQVQEDRDLLNVPRNPIVETLSPTVGRLREQVDDLESQNEVLEKH
jgi:hypothetical protein